MWLEIRIFAENLEFAVPPASLGGVETVAEGVFGAVKGARGAAKGSARGEAARSGLVEL